MREVVRIEGTITLADGSANQFALTSDGGWQQWGAGGPRLGRTVDVLESMVRGLMEDEHLVGDGEEES